KPPAVIASTITSWTLVVVRVTFAELTGAPSAPPVAWPSSPSGGGGTIPADANESAASVEPHVPVGVPPTKFAASLTSVETHVPVGGGTNARISNWN